MLLKRRYFNVKLVILLRQFLQLNYFLLLCGFRGRSGFRSRSGNCGGLWFNHRLRLHVFYLSLRVQILRDIDALKFDRSSVRHTLSQRFLVGWEIAVLLDIEDKAVLGNVA